MVCESMPGSPFSDVVPRDWAITEADSVSLKVSKGTTPPKTEVSENGGIPFLRVNNLSFYGSLQKDSDFIYVSKAAHEKFLARSKAYPGDILMNIVGPPLGKTALLDESWPEYNMNQAIVFYRLDTQHVVPEYFLAFLNSHNAQNWLQSRSKKTSGQQNLTIELCKKLPLPLPSIPEQKKIAQILSTWDQAITATERLLENSQQRKKGLMQQLLTGQKRLPGFEGEWEEFLIAELEDKGWLKLGRGKVISKKDIENKPGQYPIYSSSVKNDGLMGAYGEFMFDEELISWSVDGGGNFFYRPKHKFSVTNVSGYMRLDIDRLSYKFLAEQLAYLHERQAFNYQTKAHPSVIRKLYRVKIPSLREQQKIAQVLAVTDAEVAANQVRLECLKEEKKALMHQLLTGKRRVQVETEAA